MEFNHYLQFLTYAKIQSFRKTSFRTRTKYKKGIKRKHDSIAEFAIDEVNALLKLQFTVRYFSDASMLLNTMLYIISPRIENKADSVRNSQKTIPSMHGQGV